MTQEEIHEAVELFWRQMGSRMEGNATVGYVLPWEQQLENKRRAEEILNQCKKEELIDYILYYGRSRPTTIMSVTPNPDIKITGLMV